MSVEKEISLTILMANLVQTSTNASLVAETLERLQKIILETHGSMLTTSHANIMATFPSVDDGVHAAIGMQETVRSPTPLVHLHIGLHHGPIVKKNAEVSGAAFTIASHLLAMAKEGQIVTSKETLDQLQMNPEFDTRLIAKKHFKGLPDATRVYEILPMWDTEGISQVITEKAEGIKSVQAEVGASIHLGNKTWALNQQNYRLTLGRNPECDICLNDPAVSRHHAHLEYHRHRVMLMDESVNGTHVFYADGSMKTVRRNELELKGKGYFSLGLRVEKTSPLAILFEIT